MPALPLYRVIILGAGPRARSGVPGAITSTDARHRVLDWLLDAFSVLPDVQVNFITGHKAQEIMRRYPKIRYFHNAQWESTGPLGSLAFGQMTARRAVYVCYADTVFRRCAIERMEAAGHPCVAAVDSLWQHRYEASSRADMISTERLRFKGADVQFSGLLRLSSEILPSVRKAVHGGDPGARLSALVQDLARRKIKVDAVDLNGDWAELDAPQDLARFVLGTKAESLERLRPLLKNGRIGTQIVFDFAAWKKDAGGICGEIQRTFAAGRIIVRSSALSEDHWQHSKAGAYQSVLNVPARDSRAVAKAVADVFRSYGTPKGRDQVFVQKMIAHVRAGGVVMTRTPTMGGPYYILNIDDVSRRTDTVTSGSTDTVRTIVLARRAKASLCPAPCRKLMAAVRELEHLVGHDALDIEFAQDNKGMVHILQVRPIAAAYRHKGADDLSVSQSLAQLASSVKRINRRQPSVLGNSTVLSVMADWNPAEMIGTKPNRLAMSLYRRLITDETWAIQRVQYGYRDVRPAPLMIDLMGHPYIDARVDFNSFIPANLPHTAAARLTDHYLDHLRKAPHLHDKVEFDIVMTAMDFQTDLRLRALGRAGFDRRDIQGLREGLIAVTRHGMARYSDDLASVQAFAEQYDALRRRRGDHLAGAFALLEETRTRGVLHFAHLARGAFIAAGLLRSAVAAGILSQEQTDAFMSSLNTVSGMMRRDAMKVAGGQMSWPAFVAMYGHLRPGTYDITSMCYADSPREFLRPLVDAPVKMEKSRFKGFSSKSMTAMIGMLAAMGIHTDAVRLEDFLRRTIEGREWAKFIFTRHVNAALKDLAAFGRSRGFEPEQLSHVPVDVLFGMAALGPARQHAALKEAVREGQEASQITQALHLPDVIRDAADVDCMEYPAVRPNFVTQRKVRGEVLVVMEPSDVHMDLTGKIMVVEKADPGYDWIFGRGIAGFMTMYGGANSHMAIRASEFQLPAAIGIGESLFAQMQRASVVELDCAGRRITVVR